MDAPELHIPVTSRCRFAEHSLVHLTHPLASDDGVLPIGARGVIVHCYEAAPAYEVEFIEPFHIVATVEEALLSQ